MEVLARTAITAGGAGTILAVGMIFVFLVWVVVPLFSAPELGEDERFLAPSDAAPFHMGVDEERLLGWTLHRDGVLELHDLTTGERVDTAQPFGNAPPTAASFGLADDSAVFGFEDGTARIGRVGFRTDFLEEDDVPEDLAGLVIGAAAVHEGGVVDRTAIGQLRRTQLEVELGEPMETGDPSAVRHIDHVVSPSGLSLVMHKESGALRVSRERTKRNLLTGEVAKSLKHADLVREAGDTTAERPAPVAVRMGGLGQHVYAVGSDGSTEHWDLRDFTAPRLFEEIDLTPDDDSAVTAVGFVAGRQTLVVGDARGRISTWFPARGEDGDADPLLQRVHDLEAGDSAAISIAASPRSRTIAVGFESGQVRFYQATLGKQLLSVQSEEAARTLFIPPKEDAVVARGVQRVVSWELDLKHPEASARALFQPVWYEGYEGPSHVWQSSSASDDFEPKMGLMPLVFGTLKATLYSMLFGAPLAILAALYTSEFLAPRLRSSIKSTVELMASLPSVVLGFIGALVIAPFVQDILPAVMAAFLTVPLALLTGAYLWQLLPSHRVVRWAGWQRFLAITLCLPFGAAAAAIGGPLLESLIFGGDVSAWLGGQSGGAWGGWFLLLLPVAALAVTLVFGLWVGPRLRAAQADASRERLARLEALKFLVAVICTVLAALVVAFLLQGVGLDPRGSVVGTYVQRNALIVGFVMGFAIVPIIYTLAEDALSEVPSALREGSLGAGATPWQTAVRIVIPFAMSGIFSALMIGLGRAVGETMIVLMAAGNTPIMEWNIFNGFRTLSANIAVELPEAVKGSGHYRTLFLAALVLFALTFALNMVAEFVRRRFRSRFQAL